MELSKFGLATSWMRARIKVVLVTFLVVVGCPSVRFASASPWEEILRKAKSEGKVVLLGPPKEGVRRAVLRDFQKAYPDIILEYQGGNLGSFIPRLRAEQKRGATSIDITITGSSTILRNKDMFEPLPPRLLLSEAVDADVWRSSEGKGLKFNDREQQFSLQTSEWVFGYVLGNTELVDPDSLNSWHDFLQPKWKRKIAFHDPRGSGAGEEVASYLLLKFGEKYVVDLFKGQEVVLTRSYSQIADWLAQKKYAIGIAQTADRIEQLRREGIPLVAFSLPDAPGTLSGGFSVIAVIRNASHPSAATVLLNWLLTRQGQEAIHRPQFYPSLRRDVPRDYVPQYVIPKPNAQYLDTYGEDFLGKRDELARQVSNLLGR